MASQAANRDGTSESGSKLGLIPCLAFAVGTMVGGGVFTLSGVALNDAGPAAIVSYLLAGVIMLVSAISFVAVAGRAAEGDSGYGPIADILSPAWRFLTMWGFYINGLTIVTFLLLSFGEYLNEYFVSGMAPITAGIVATIAIVALNLGPADLVGKLETYIVGLKIVLLGVLIAWGLASFTDIEFRPFAPEGGRSVFTVTAMLFTCYTGFNVVTNMAGNVQNPQRNVPIAVIGSILISATIYIGVILAMMASGVEEFGPAGVGEAAEALMGEWGGYLIAFAACLSTLSGGNANVLGASEITTRLVAQGDVPPAVGRETSSGHPFVSVLFIGAVTVVLVLVADSNNIVGLANVGALVAMVIVNVAAITLAVRGWPGEGLRIPGGPILPIIGAITCLLQFPSLGGREVSAGLGLVAVGFVLYFTRHRPDLSDGVLAKVHARVAAIETPLARALRPINPWRS